MSSIEKKYESALFAIEHLREAVKKVLEQYIVKDHSDSCHCVYCELAHAMSATSGYEDLGKTEKDA